MGRGLDKKPRKPRAVLAPIPPPGPGRPVGTSNALPTGMVSAIKGLRYRVPPDMPEPLAEVADDALQTVIDVMNGKVLRGSLARLGAARTLRDEVCGPLAQKLDVNVNVGLAERLQRARQRVDGE